MKNFSEYSTNDPEDPDDNSSSDKNSFNSVDYIWFEKRFEFLIARLALLEEVITMFGESVADSELVSSDAIKREYYSVPEFATLVVRGEYTVREWCRHARIHAEKCDSGRGDAKSWKIPAEELERYRNHGLLTIRYPR